MGDLVERIRRVLTIQELRQAGYKSLKKAQDDYASQQTSADDYQKSMTDVTTSFQSLSQEMIEISTVFREHPLPEAAGVLDKIQAKEKEKLQLTAQWQMLQAERSGVDGESCEEMDEDFGEAVHKLKSLRQKLAAVEGAIAELVQDLRYECEPFLLAETVIN